MTADDVAQALPDIPTLRNLCRSMAVLEAVLNPDGERYYTFSPHWSDSEEIASMRNGSGDEFDIVFSPTGAYLRGFDHESPMSPYADDEPWPGVLDSVPEVFRGCVEEPAFCDDGMPRVTACIWREVDSDSWQVGEIDFPSGHADPDGSGWLFQLLTDRTPQAYQRFAEDYYEKGIDIDLVRNVYALRPVTLELIQRLNPDASVAGIVKEVGALGYPVNAALPRHAD